MRALPDGPLVAWYGDDFTGSAAVAEVLAFAGFPAVLFFDIPTDDQLRRFADYRGIGVAGFARSKGIDWMRQSLPRVFEFLLSVGAPVRHYKVCSTLDSSPDVGSIGCAADLALAPGEWAPVVLAAPDIGRYQAFGTLFARAGEGIHRLDRHPTMSVHPVTPMDEADVGRHLERQTDQRTGLVDLLALKAGTGADRLASERQAGKSLVTFDVVDDETLQAAGEIIWQVAEDSLFSIGSQGVEYALVAAWRAAGFVRDPEPQVPLVGVDQIAVVSGSCSPVTAEQIAVAEAHGFTGVKLDVARAVDPVGWQQTCGQAREAALQVLAMGNCPIVFTSRGPGDGSSDALRAAVAQSGRVMAEVNEAIGTGLGRVLDGLITECALGRVAIAGGDSSSFGAQQLGLYAVTAQFSLGPGAALLTGHSDDAARDGLEIALKGGQMGRPDFFVELRDGTR